MSIFGYCRISRKSQRIDRQIRNILKAYPEAIIIEEVFTGTKVLGRKALDKILKVVKAGDTIVFDSASRMSRNSQEAMDLYEFLYSQGVELVFLKEPHINTEVYKATISKQVVVDLNTGSEATDELIGGIMEVLNRYTIALAKEQIKIVFDQAEKEVLDLHQRTAEGILTAKMNGKTVGIEKGRKLTTKKSIKAKEDIKKYSKDFDGSLEDSDVIKLIGISRNSFYKYKKEIRLEIIGPDPEEE